MKKEVIKKLNQDDILEILIEYFQDDELRKMKNAQGVLLGEPDKDLRFIGVFGNHSEIFKYDLEEIDKNVEFNGFHSFVEKCRESHIDNKE